MAKKTKNEKFEELKTSAEKVWLAGLGALALAEKQGDKLFRSLVKKGKKFEELIPAAGDAVKDSVSTARKQANRTFAEMEAAFDRHVANAVRRAGLARQSEVESLKKELAALKKASRTSGRSSKKATTKKSTPAIKK